MVIKASKYNTGKDLLVAAKNGEVKTLRYVGNAGVARPMGEQVPPAGLLSVSVNPAVPDALILTDEKCEHEYVLPLTHDTAVRNPYGRNLNTLHNDGKTELKWVINPSW